MAFTVMLRNGISQAIMARYYSVSIESKELLEHAQRIKNNILSYSYCIKLCMCYILIGLCRAYFD